MSQSKFLANRLREVFLNGKWIANTNYKDQIETLDWQQATKKIGHLNTIALLVYHINYYLAGLIDVFNKGELKIRDMYSFDSPPITSQADWENLKSEFLSNAEEFCSKVELMTDQQFTKPFVNEHYGTYLRNIEGIIEHSYYHLGQVAIIKKMILENEKR